MSEHVGPVTGEEAGDLLRAAHRLRDIAHHLGQRPDRIDPLLRDVDAALLAVSFFLHDAGRVLREEAPKAASTLRDESRSLTQATYAAAMLESAAGILEQGRHALMSATAETSYLLWPQHDPVAAEELARYCDLFSQRSAAVTPDITPANRGAGLQPPAPER